jgi:LytS/YehU family sensor histidine kinase
MPVEETAFTSLLGSHLLAAVVVSFFWVLVGRALARGLSGFPAFHGLSKWVTTDTPLLLAIGVLLYLLAVALFYVLLAQEASREAEQREMQARVLARDAELRALKAQVNPHFLFNSLHSISALTSSDPKRAREMCIALADFLRATLGLGEKELIAMEEELSLIHSFLAVEKIRFGQRLQMEERIDQEVLQCMVPPLILQPLVENAVAHGIANLTEGGWIRLDASYRGDDSLLSITVDNSFDPETPPRRKSGLGLANVRQRLATRYGDHASFLVEKNGTRFHVALSLPAERSAATA